jgi:hypothetical protein
VLARTTEYWRACVGVAIIVIVTAFPHGIASRSVLPGPRRLVRT